MSWLNRMGSCGRRLSTSSVWQVRQKWRWMSFAVAYPKLKLPSKVGRLILGATRWGVMNTVSIFQMYFSYYHMFFPEYGWGYAQEKGEIKNNQIALKMAKW